MDARRKIKDINRTGFENTQVMWRFIDDFGIPNEPGLYIVGYVDHNDTEQTTWTYYDKYGNWRGIPNDYVYAYSRFPKAPSRIIYE